MGRENVEGVRAARTGIWGGDPPTSTLVIVSGLAREEFLVEVEAVAYVE